MTFLCRFCQCHSLMQKLKFQIVLHFCVTFLSSTHTTSFKQLTGTFCRPLLENILISFAVIDLFLVLDISDEERASFILKIPYLRVKKKVQIVGGSQFSDTKVFKIPLSNNAIIVWNLQFGKFQIMLELVC